MKSKQAEHDFEPPFFPVWQTERLHLTAGAVCDVLYGGEQVVGQHGEGAVLLGAVGHHLDGQLGRVVPEVADVVTGGVVAAQHRLQQRVSLPTSLQNWRQCTSHTAHSTVQTVGNT